MDKKAHTSDLAWQQPTKTGLLVLADGSVLEGRGFGAEGTVAGEVCFNTAMTGYQEILTDPSYADQIITFTFPHIGNNGANEEDIEAIALGETSVAAVGCIVKAPITPPANYRSQYSFDHWLKLRGIIGLSGIDTRSLTILIREKGMLNAIIAHHHSGKFDIAKLKDLAAHWPGINGTELAHQVSVKQRLDWREECWSWPQGYRHANTGLYKVVAIDYGLKRNILRCLTSISCEVVVVPATSSAEEILALKPDGIFLSNGPGDPAATGNYAVPEIRRLIKSGLPIFGICLGHQLLALALGAKTKKMHQGHHGANHPVQDINTGKVEIVSMNHGFAVERTSLPEGVVETHLSLFDGSNCGLSVKDHPIFSVQYHPEASPGPQDSLYLFKQFVDNMAKSRSPSPG